MALTTNLYLTIHTYDQTTLVTEAVKRNLKNKQLEGFWFKFRTGPELGLKVYP